MRRSVRYSILTDLAVPYYLSLARFPQRSTATTLLPSRDPSPPDMSLTRDLPIRSVGFPPTNAVHPPACQHGVFIPFAPIETRSAPAFSRCYPRSFTFYLGKPVSSIHATGTTVAGISAVGVSACR